MVNRIPSIQTALMSSDEEVRRKAIQDVRGLSLHDARDLIFTAMGDESWRIRKEAVELFVGGNPDQNQIADLLELLRNEDNAGLRNSAAEAVIRLGCRSATPLIHMVNDPDADVRKFVVDVMGNIPDQTFIPSLLSALQDADVNVAAAAAEHIGNIGTSAHVPALLNAIAENSAELFRFSALASIGKLATPAPVPEVIRTLADNELLRKAVYDCLGSIADESAMSILLEGMGLSQKSSRNAALMAVYRLYLRSDDESRQAIESSLHVLRGGNVVSLLMDSFDPYDVTLSEAVIVVLDIIGDKRCVEVLLRAYVHERLARFALTALRNLGTDGMDVLLSSYNTFDEERRAAVCSLIGDCLYLPGSAIVSRAIGDGCQRVQRAAVASAGKLGLTNCIPAIVDLLNTNDTDLRDSVVTCLQALALLDRGAVLSVASQMADSLQPDLRRNAAVLFAALGDCDRLSLMAKDENPLVREAAVISIGRLRFSAATGTLLIALVDENPDVRIAAAEALGAVGDDTVVDPLTHALQDDDMWVQCAALKSLAAIDPATALESVTALSAHADGLLMLTCIDLLDHVGGEEALNLVVRALDNGDSEIVVRALEVIARHSSERLIDSAPRLLSHSNWNIRISCARAVAYLPAEKAAQLISAALAHEDNDVVRAEMHSLLKGLA